MNDNIIQWNDQFQDKWIHKEKIAYVRLDFMANNIMRSTILNYDLISMCTRNNY